MSNINAEKYVSKYKVELLRLYSSIYSGLELDSIVFEVIEDDMLEKIAAKMTILSHKYFGSKLIFSVPKDFTISRSDELFSDEFYSIILCEKQVKNGALERDGDFYIAKDVSLCKFIPKYKKYIKSK
jgi:hypothetical protein